MKRVALLLAGLLPLAACTVGPNYRRPTAVAPAAGALAGLPDGPWRLGVRAEHLRVGAVPPGGLGFAGTVSVTEITGSESYVHADIGVAHWVALLPGVSESPPGAPVQLHFDPAHLFVFGPDGALVSIPGARAAA